MPGEVIDRANPPPGHSHLPESVLDLAVKLDISNALNKDELNGVVSFRRAANYVAAAMIFLRDNVLMEKELTADDIKPRLLGHWGTCPGLTLVYAHLNLLIKRSNVNMIYVVGPGHGAPGILSSLWIEGTLAKFYTDYTVDRKGLTKLISKFSTPGGFPSHVNAEVPGAIHEGGELGYALAVAYGAVLDKPDLIVTAVIGDGEAETGPTATAWHLNKYLDPAESGAVIPIVHINGFKISERTIYGCMDDRELVSLFTGYGYQVRFVEDLANIDADMATSLQWALHEIRAIQKAAREGKPIFKPRWPVLLLRTPKGWSGPKKFHGEFIEGSFHAHQVPIPDAKTDDDGRKALAEWLNSYEPSTLFKEDGSPIDAITYIVPKEDGKKMGQVRETYAGYAPLSIPAWADYAVEKGPAQSSMKVLGDFLDATFQANPHTLRLFSPDELESNKLSAVLNHTSRNFQWDEYSRAQGGRVVEILSEHSCQGMIQGYTLTGRTALFPSYESFLGIVHTMMIQTAKFVKLAKETPFREMNASINYIETSTWARQEHNGFSHQNPSFIGAVLNLKPAAARVYLPPDANCFLSTAAHCLRSRGYVNLMVGSKQPTPVWLSPEQADAHCKAGASIFEFASTERGINPDVVLVGIGTEVTFEVVAAAALLRALLPELRVRVVNVTDLMILGPHGSHPHALSDADFDALFTRDRPVVVNYHGYANELMGLLFHRPQTDRIHIEGYREEGTTTSPFDMMLVNCVSRYHVAAQAIEMAGTCRDEVSVRATGVRAELQHRISKDREYILKEGQDPEGTYDTPRFE